LTREGTGRRLLNGLTVATTTLFKLLSRCRPDVILVDSTSPFLLVVTWIMNRIRRVPYVFLVQDVYPEIAIELGVIRPRSISEKFWRLVYKRVYQSATRIIVLGTRMQEIINRSLPAYEYGKVTVIPNWADGQEIVPRASDDNYLRKNLELDDKIVVIYSGNMGLVHDMETVLEAAVRLKELSGLRFLFVGGGAKRDWVANMIELYDLPNVVMLPYQPIEVLPYSLTCGDISLVSLRRGMEGLSVPSKIYSSLAAGLAILAVAGPSSEIADVVEGYKCGIRVSQGDVDSFVEAVERMYHHPNLIKEMKDRSRECFEKNYTRKISIDSYAQMLRAVVGHKGAKTR